MALRDHIARILEEGHARAHPDIVLGASHDETPEGDHLPSAVLIAITDRPEPGLILTQRSEQLRKHPGQVAFPGGRVDPEDADAIAAALREAKEEIGLPPALVDVIGTTDPFRTHTGYSIIPVVAVIPPDVDFVPEPREVDAIFEVPLAYALDPTRRSLIFTEFEGRMRDYHEILWKDRRIWGVTAGMLVNLSYRLDLDSLRASGAGR
ncbi:CoA pyrophosphatase [Sphingobium sufflavum]|uniref:CoA pyrophosphatase n=1 Tax=Sphingobium sufflavum TaxID=1129547 RepID=UPI001F226E61|nr:CoA pyrophosphatase [Sphingobium sufflavum]MCE7794999.1 CoA pyrophosphatase [Sphingobium sufflavum]